MERSSSVRLRLGKFRKNERPACRQLTRAFTFRFTSACTRCAIRSPKKSGRTASSTSTTITDVAATAAMRLDRFINHLGGNAEGAWSTGWAETAGDVRYPLEV